MSAMKLYYFAYNSTCTKTSRRFNDNFCAQHPIYDILSYTSPDSYASVGSDKINSGKHYFAHKIHSTHTIHRQVTSVRAVGCT